MVISGRRVEVIRTTELLEVFKFDFRTYYLTAYWRE